MAKDSEGNVYVLDTAYHRLCVIRQNDQQTNEHKVLTNDLNIPSGIAVSDRHIFVSDAGDHCIKKLDVSGNCIARWGQAGIHEGQLIGPQGLAIDSSNQLYVVDTGNQRIQVFNMDGQFVRVLPTPELIQPVSIAFSSDGHLFITDKGKNSVFLCNDQGEILKIFYANDPSGLAIVSNETLIVIEKENHHIVFLDINTGKPIKTLGELGYDIGQFKQPDSILVLSDHHFLVSDRGNGRIQEWNTEFSLFSGSPKHDPNRFYMISDLAVSDNAELFIADYEKDTISEFSASGEKINHWGVRGHSGGQFNGPFALLMGPDNHLYISDAGNHRIQVFDTKGNFLFQWGTKGISLGEFHFPTHLTSDHINNVYVVDTFNHRIQKFSANGEPLISWGKNGTGPGDFRFPLGIAYDGLDHIYVADFGNNRIQVFNTNGQYLWHKDLTGNRLPSSIAYNPINASIFGLFTGGKSIQEFDADSLSSLQNPMVHNGMFTPASCSQFPNSKNRAILFPFNIQTDPSGRLYVADAHQNTIYTFRRLYSKDISGMLQLFTNMKQDPIMSFRPDTNSDGRSNWFDFMETFEGVCCQEIRD